MPAQIVNRSICTVMPLITAASFLVMLCADAGIQGTGRASISAYGEITGDGAAEVGGVEFGTSKAHVRINDRSGKVSELALGQVVFVTGTLNANGTSAEAAYISFASNVQGEVTQADLANDTFVVLGQTVRLTDATLFGTGIQPGGSNELTVGSRVQVSGFVNSAGELVATRVDPESARTLQVRGTIRNLDVSANTFQVNSLTVDFSGAKVTGPITNGSKVKVRGDSISSTGALQAGRVQASKGGLRAKRGDRAALQGFITQFTSETDFNINGQRVITDADTSFVLNGKALGLDAAIEVLGAVNESGDLLASKVEVTH
jgi:Domain of unknown function (DUF5666)